MEFNLANLSPQVKREAVVTIEESRIDALLSALDQNFDEQMRQELRRAEELNQQWDQILRWAFEQPGRDDGGRDR